MTEVIIFNVGDGDSTLIRHREPGKKDFNILVDAGRPYLDWKEGSRRLESVYQLLREGVDHIDIMFLTHLHVDHVGGAVNILERIPVRKIMTPYIPPEGSGRLTPPWESEIKKIIGMYRALDMLEDILMRAKEKGVICEQCEPGMITVSEDFVFENLYTDFEAVKRQRKVFDRIFKGEIQTTEELLWASEQRNSLSLVQKYQIYGKKIMMCADAYGKDFANVKDVYCDIIKIGHHGDKKSMTDELLERLSPEYAVISCQNDPDAKKERPSTEVMEKLLKKIPNVICTENREMPFLKGSTRFAVRFKITQDGDISCSSNY